MIGRGGSVQNEFMMPDRFSGGFERLDAYLSKVLMSYWAEHSRTPQFLD